jgi:NarL family two-component system sensor histidine kinase LiaS
MQRFIHSFRQLRWKLTLSYALTSVVAFLLVIMLIGGGGLLWLGTHMPDVILTTLNQQAAQGSLYITKAASDPEPLTTWLQIDVNTFPGQDPFHLRPHLLAVTNRQGIVIASTGSQPLAPGTSLANLLSLQGQANLSAVLNDAQGKTSRIDQEANNTLVAIVPMQGSNKTVEGALVLKVDRPQEQLLFSYFFDLIFYGGTMALVLTLLIGSIFGYLIARGLTRRLKRMAAAADSWSHGDFSVLANDTSHDELGQMAHQFNHMAEQLKNLLKTRQLLATLEERNRLARDLHDSVKQQVFAISMQIASTRILLKRDVDAAGQRLEKAEKLVHQAQQELTSLIRELRPVALEGQGLVAALRELLPQWSQQTDIVATIKVEGSAVLPLTVEEALFRVAQEALSNIARHSSANLVQMTLILNDETITLTIQDNGQGFDPARLDRRGVGLHSMQERMKILGGDLQVKSAPGKGTLIVAHCARLGTDGSTANGQMTRESLPG